MADIPMDLIREILSHCPVKSVIRFKILSPEWFHLISSPAFVAQHLRSSRLPIFIHVCTPQLLTQRLYSYGIRSVHRDADFHSFEAFPGSSTATVYSLNFIGSPNGVVCVVRHRDIHQDLVLWNPITNSTRRLPAPTLLFNRETHTRLCLGIGFHPPTGDYKIVRLLERNSNMSDQVEVFSVNLGRWTVSATHTSRMMMTDAPCVVANGVPYWVGIKEVAGCRTAFIDGKRKKRRSLQRDQGRLVLFDVGNDRFRTEDFAWEAESSQTLLGVRNDCLCAMVWDDGAMHRFDLWVKDANRWTLRYVQVEPPGNGLQPLFCGDVGIVYREEVREEVSLIVFDPTGVEDVEEINLIPGFQLNDCIRVLGWADALTEIPHLGPGNVN